MTRLEMVEKVREKTGVSYDEAKTALDLHDWDMIDTVVALDKAGTAKDSRKQGAETTQEEKKQPHVSLAKVGDKVFSVLKWILAVINKGESIRFEISRRGEDVGSISVTVLVLLLFIAWWLPVLPILVGLFCGYRYSFSGNSTTGRMLNKITNAASDKADELKSKLSEDN